MSNALTPIDKIANAISPDVCQSIPVEAHGLAPQNVLQMLEVARLLAVSAEAVPKPLRGKPGLCFAVAQQAARAKMDPWAVASKAYVVNDRVAFEAQFIIALINTRAGLEEKLDYAWTGAEDEMRCTVSGTFPGGKVRSIESPEIGSIKPKNSPLWAVDPRRQLAYWTARSWARLHAPEVMLGVESADDLKDAPPMRDVTPARPSLMARYAKPSHAVEGEQSISERTAAAATDGPDKVTAPKMQGGPDAQDVDALWLLHDEMMAAESLEELAEVRARAGDSDEAARLGNFHESRIERAEDDPYEGAVILMGVERIIGAKREAAQ